MLLGASEARQAARPLRPRGPCLEGRRRGSVGMPQRLRTSDRGGTSTVVPLLNFTWIGVPRALYAR